MGWAWRFHNSRPLPVSSLSLCLPLVEQMEAPSYCSGTMPPACCHAPCVATGVKVPHPCLATLTGRDQLWLPLRDSYQQNQPAGTFPGAQRGLSSPILLSSRLWPPSPYLMPVAGTQGGSGVMAISCGAREGRVLPGGCYVSLASRSLGILALLLLEPQAMDWHYGSVGGP